MKQINRITKTIITFSFLLFAKSGFASPQLPDYIIFKGDTIPVYNLILEQYFEKIEKSDQESLFGLNFREGASVNCWRGYQAIYIIENDSLFLKDIIHCGELYGNNLIDKEASRTRTQEIFKDNVRNNKVHLKWFSGEFSLPNGELLRWDGVFYKRFEKEKLIRISKGIVKEVLKVENYIDDPDRINRRYDDTISNVLFEELQNLNWTKNDKFDCSEKYLVTIDKEGEISKVVMADYQSKDDIKEFWDKGEYKYCINIIQKGLKGLKFDIVKQNGERVSEEVYIEIWFDTDTQKIENWTN